MSLGCLVCCRKRNSRPLAFSNVQLPLLVAGDGGIYMATGSRSHDTINDIIMPLTRTGLEWPN